MPQFKLTYFPIKGRAEPIRLTFAEAGIPYEDCRIKFEDWPSVKAKTPMCSLPLLEAEGGRVLCQTHAICGYLGGIFNLSGNNAFQAGQCYMFAGGVEDLWVAIGPYLHTKDIEQKKKLYQIALEKNVKPFLSRYDGFLRKNPSGFLVGDEVTWADFVLYNCASILLQDKSNLKAEHYPKLKEFLDKISDLPRIKEWLQKRPETEF